MEEYHLVATISIGLAVLTIVVALAMNLVGGKEENPWPRWWLWLATAWAVWVGYLVQKGVR